MSSEVYFGWGLLPPICMFFIYGRTSLYAMTALGYPQESTAGNWLKAALPGALLYTFWCVFNLNLLMLYIIAYFCHVLRWLHTQDSREKELFSVNLLHIMTISIHMTVIAFCALAGGVSMSALLAQPFWRLFITYIVIAVRIGADLLIPWQKEALQVIRSQSESAEKGPFMLFLWFCSIFLVLDSLLCTSTEEWVMLPVLLITGIALKQFFILRCLLHLYSIMKVRHLEEQYLTLEQELARQTRQAADLQNRRDTDILTGVFSRQYLMEQLEQLLQAEAAFSLVFLDLDRLKQLNDKKGHKAGDEYLIQFARSFRAQLRENDVFARVGGDEFVALLPGCSEEDARDKLYQIRSLLSGRECCGHNLSFSFGVAGTSGRAGEDMSQLLRRADLAMYHDKEQRRG